MKEKLTIIIATHNRPALIARALDYYMKWNCTIFVCDSSCDRPKFVDSPKIQVLHTPELLYNQKIHEALKKVITPYVCMSADDDFLAESGIMTSIRFLEEHKDYVSAQGHYVMFNWVLRQVLIYPHYLNTIGYNINAANSAQRIVQSMNPYMHQIYSVHRTNVFQKSFLMMSDLDINDLIELGVSINCMIYGKHMMLPVFWMARDCCRYTIYTDSTVRATSLIGVNAGLKKLDSLHYRDRFSKEYSYHTGESLDKGREVFSQAFSEYLGLRKNSKINKKLRHQMKKFIPEIFLQLYRLFFGKLMIPWRYSNFPGYPFGDSVARKDWDSMNKIIVKHGEIPDVRDQHIPCRGR